MSLQGDMDDLRQAIDELKATIVEELPALVVFLVWMWLTMLAVVIVWKALK